MNDYRNQQSNYSNTNWSQPQQWGTLTAPTAAEAPLAERLSFIRKVYALFFVGILCAIGGVLAGLMFPPIMALIIQHPIITMLLLFGGVIAAQAVRQVPVLNLVAFVGFTGLTGLVISPLMYFYGQTNPNSLWQAGLMTVGLFGGLTAYVFISKKDFSFLRGMVTTGLIILILGGLVNIFLGSAGFSFGLAVAALLLFAGYVLYDTSNIIRRYPTNEYIAGALSLYLDFWNIFLAILRILNAGRR